MTASEELDRQVLLSDARRQGQLSGELNKLARTQRFNDRFKVGNQHKR